MSKISRLQAVTELRPASAHEESSSYPDATTGETELLEEMIELLRRQRQAVADDDLQVLDDLTAAIHRLLRQVEDVRKSRESVWQDPDHRTSDRRASAEIRAAALALTREIELNRRILRDALSRTDEYAQEVIGSLNPTARGLDDPTTGAFLINRTV